MNGIGPPKRSAPGREIAGAAKLRLPQTNSGIHFYNRELKGLGWLPVTKLSAEVQTVLDFFGPETITELVEGVLNNPPDVCIPDRRTLVRLCWENY